MGQGGVSATTGTAKATMPVATQTQTLSTELGHLKLRAESPPRTKRTSPMKYNGSFDKYSYFEVTPSIGREFTKDLQLKALLEAPDSEALLRDLAVMVSRRGVCFFRGQDISGQEMLELASRMADATGRPKESKLCIHPVSEVTPELMTGRANQTMEISASKQRKGGGINRRYEDVSRWASVAWHTDISFERVPSDYSMLKINTLPPSGGDTLWINTADVVERMSPSFREYLEGLTAEHNAHFFHDEARRLGIKIKTDLERGHPLNKDDTLEAHHPVIRTNPITGWKALYVNRGFTKRIDDVSKDESDMILNYLNNIAIHQIDMQVRFRWEKGSIALWDNRSTWHSATFDYTEERVGERASSIGEVPYLDKEGSMLRSESLTKDGVQW